MREKIKQMNGVEMIEDDLFLIKRTEYPSSNSLLVLDDTITLIDTGSNRKIIKKISNDIETVLNSHYHYDHILNNGLFKEVRISHIESPALKTLENYVKMCGIQDAEITKEFKNQLNEKLPDPKPWQSNVNPYSIKDELESGNTTWKVIHTPGHSPGHCCFYEENSNILFAGDYGPEEFGPWYGWPSSDLPCLIESVKKIIDLKPTIIIGSHSALVEKNITPTMKNQLNIIKKRDKKISKLHKKGEDVQKILNENIFYSKKAKKNPIIKYCAKTMISKHLKTNIQI